MENSYDIYMGSEIVGSASFIKEGLYWKIHCRCRLSGDVAHRVLVKAGEEIDLGILAPEGEEFCLTKRIAMKRLADAEPEFRIKPRTPKTERSFHPITPDEPFSYIEKLKDSYLEERNGEVGITLAEEEEEQGLETQDSDPSQECQSESEPE